MNVQPESVKVRSPNQSAEPTAVKRMYSSWLAEFSRIHAIWTGTFPRGSSGASRRSWLETGFLTLLLLVRIVSFGRFKDMAERHSVRSELSELYVVAWFIGLIVLLNTGPYSFVLASIIVWYRLIDSLSYRLCILFIDHYEEGWKLRSLNRSLLLLLINYAELVVGFAILYISSRSIASSSNHKAVVVDATSAVYFSAVTAFTLGYGDLIPIDMRGRALVTSQLTISFVLVALVVSAFLSGVDFIRDETKPAA